MKSVFKVSAFLGMTALLVPAVGATDPVIEVLQASKLHANFRLRYESVDDSVNDDADALTLRSYVGFTSGQLSGFSVVAEFVDVRIVGGVADYAPNRPGFAVVADPEVTDVNRAFIRYQGIDGVDLGLGRQRLIYDNARFVGNVGWRQNEQTFDAFSAVLKPLPDVTVSYAYLDRVNGIVPALDFDSDSHLLNIQYDGLSFGKLSVYSYLLENEDNGPETDSYGVRFSGATQFDGFTLLYTAEYAYQEAKRAVSTFYANYGFAELGVSIAGVTVKAAYELMGSDDGQFGFDTPLATKHGFNGWADKFLATPATGLRDTFVTLATTVTDVNLMAVYHWYKADEGSADLGEELNLQASKAFGKHYSLGAKYARYMAHDFSADTNKFWLWGELKF